MQIDQIYTACLSQASYFIESNGEAAVIDPLREIDYYLNKADRTKSFKYVDGADTFEASSAGVALDLRISNANAVSYFGVLDNSAHKKLLTRDALYLDISGSGTSAVFCTNSPVYLNILVY